MQINSLHELYIWIKHIVAKQPPKESSMPKDERIVKYIELRYISCTTRKEIEHYLIKTGKPGAFGTMDDFYASEKGVTYEMFLFFENQYTDEIARVKRIKRLYNSDRKKGFKSLSDFYIWFNEQGDKCYYCGVQESLVTYLFSHDILKSKRSRGKYFEIDRKDPDGLYTKENCVLTCYFCNNDKSDIFDHEQYKQIIIDGRKQFLEQLHEKMRVVNPRNNDL